MPVKVLVLYDSRGGLIERLAQGVGQGVEGLEGAEAVLKRIDDAGMEDLIAADAIVFGSPNWSGITGKMKLWLDSLGDLWEEGQIKNKVGAAFTAGASRSAGIEFTLLTLIHWMFTGGMIIVGLPWSERMATSGSYYGPTASGTVLEDDVEQARALGRRVAEVAAQLRKGESS